MKILDFGIDEHDSDVMRFGCRWIGCKVKAIMEVFDCLWQFVKFSTSISKTMALNFMMGNLLYHMTPIFLARCDFNPN